jgi:hypothetical protein
LAIKNKKTPQLRKTIIVYVVLTAAAVVFDQIYALFGHGVHSSAMSLMFMYPLLGGAFFYLLAGICSSSGLAAGSLRRRNAAK